MFYQHETNWNPSSKKEPPKDKQKMFEDMFHYYQHSFDDSHSITANDNNNEVLGQSLIPKHEEEGMEDSIHSESFLEYVKGQTMQTDFHSSTPMELNGGSREYLSIGNGIELQGEKGIDENRQKETSQQNPVILLKDIYHLLGKILRENTSQVINQASDKLLQLLHKWNIVQNQVDKGSLQSLVNKLFTKDEQQLFLQLMDGFNRQTLFPSRDMHMNGLHGNTNRNHLVKWIEHALKQYGENDHDSLDLFKGSTLDKAGSFTAFHNEMFPATNVGNRNLKPDVSVTKGNKAIMQPVMSKPEQHTIHLKSLDKVEQISHKLVDEITKIWKGSQQIRHPIGQFQLSIKITPSQLGRMNINFTQVEGEMMVHILVSSQSTKDILESNIHQLKSVFSPHQLLVEHEEGLGDEDGSHDEETFDQQRDDSKFKDDEQKDQQKNSHPHFSGLDFDVIFQSLREEIV